MSCARIFAWQHIWRMSAMAALAMRQDNLGLAIGSPLRQQSPKPPVFGLISASLITGTLRSQTIEPTLRPWWLMTQGATFIWFKNPLKRIALFGASQTTVHA